MLASLSIKPIIEKTRHLVGVGRHTWEIDVLEGDKHGLVVAEIELESAEESFHLPEWVGAEVTNDPRYYNTNLAKNPYKNW